MKVKEKELAVIKANETETVLKVINILSNSIDSLHRAGCFDETSLVAQKIVVLINKLDIK